MSESKIIASENSHWYYRDGKPCYEVKCSSKDGMRPTNIKDARKLDLVPSFTLIKDQIAKPGLDTWKLNQVLSAALTLPRHTTCKVIDGRPVTIEEPEDDFARRVINDSKEQGRKAAERGKELHEAIEDFARGKSVPMQFRKHCGKIEDAIVPFGFSLLSGGNAEHSFASELGYGGKIDWHHDSGVLIDFKTKDRIDDKKQLVWDEHPMQCAAYGYGVFWGKMVEVPYGVKIPPFKFRGLNVFIGVDDCEVRVFEHSWEDLTRGWEMFKSLLRYWQIKNGFK